MQFLKERCSFVHFWIQTIPFVLFLHRLLRWPVSKSIGRLYVVGKIIRWCPKRLASRWVVVVVVTGVPIRTTKTDTKSWSFWTHVVSMISMPFSSYEIRYCFTDDPVLGKNPCRCDRAVWWCVQGTRGLSLQQRAQVAQVRPPAPNSRGVLC